MKVVWSVLPLPRRRRKERMQVAEVGVVAGIVVVVDGSKAAKVVVVIRSQRDELVVEVDQGKDIKMLIYLHTKITAS